MRNKNTLVCGVGINDADYSVKLKETVGRRSDGRLIQRVVWSCPFYERWHSILKRCYSKTKQIKSPSYMGCSVCDDWIYFSNFRDWMETQDWEGMELDKDLLLYGNRVYSPSTCLFVDKRVNLFILESQAARGEFPIGVCWEKTRGKYKASCSEVNSSKSVTLGRFDTPQEAHNAWLVFKLEQAHILAAEQTDERVAKALINRYENYIQT